MSLSSHGYDVQLTGQAHQPWFSPRCRRCIPALNCQSYCHSLSSGLRLLCCSSPCVRHLGFAEAPAPLSRAEIHAITPGQASGSVSSSQFRHSPRGTWSVLSIISSSPVLVRSLSPRRGLIGGLCLGSTSPLRWTVRQRFLWKSRALSCSSRHIDTERAGPSVSAGGGDLAFHRETRRSRHRCVTHCSCNSVLPSLEVSLISA